MQQGGVVKTGIRKGRVGRNETVILQRRPVSPKRDEQRVWQTRVWRDLVLSESQVKKIILYVMILRGGKKIRKERKKKRKRKKKERKKNERFSLLDFCRVGRTKRRNSFERKNNWKGKKIGEVFFSTKAIYDLFLAI